MHPFVVLFDLVALFSMCAGQQATTCNVVSKDQYIKYGSDTEVVCQTSCLPGRVFWTLDNQPVDESLSKTVNSSHNVLTLRNFTHHSATLQCHSAQTRQILGGTYIRTYQKPTRLSCVLHQENQDETGVPGLLTCHWQHHASSPNINYTLLYASPSDTNNKSICSSQVTHCTCKSKLRVTGEAWLTVRARTRHWEVDSDRFTFDPYTIMKMRHPLVEVTAFPDRVEVKWSLSVSFRTRHCQVRYAKVQAVNGEIPEPKVLSKTLQHQEKGVETLTEVESCTNYTISVRCAIDKAPWSDWSREKLVLTGLNKGHIKLRVWRKIADPGENQTRKVHIMWTEIPSTCRGTFTYTIKKTRCAADTPGANYTYTPCGRPACDVDVNQDAHRISLVVLENQTLLAEESVYVPATGESLPRVTDIQTSSLKGAILVSWKAPDQPVSGYVIDWTHCGNQYYWKESKYTNTTLFDLLDKKPYNITVTPVFDNKTGQGTQALQVCSRFGDPADVKIISVEANVKTVFVGWNTNSQEECSGAIINYTVYYGTANGPMLNITVDSTRQDINLKDLDPDTQYSVYVEASALTGSTKSNKRVFKTKRFDPNLPVALGACGSIVIVLVFSVGLFCAIQWKKFNEKPVPNPGLSSLRLWSSTGPQKRMGSFQSFSTPSDSIMDRISTTNTEEPQRTSTSPLATNCNDSPAGENPQEYTDPAVVQTDESREQVLCSPGESTALLPSDSSPLSPYRSQSSVEALTSTAVKQCRCVPAKPLEKMAPVTVYVTLDICDQGQSR